MAITYKIHATNWREEQFEIFYDLLEDGKVIAGNQIFPMGKVTPGSAEVSKVMAESIIPDFKSVRPEPELIYTKTEIEELLKEKGYLAENEKLDDLEDKVEIK